MLRKTTEPSMVVHIYNLNTQEAEARRIISLRTDWAIEPVSKKKKMRSTVMENPTWEGIDHVTITVSLPPFPFLFVYSYDKCCGRGLYRGLWRITCCFVAFQEELRGQGL
jgi:hypothetical protein